MPGTTELRGYRFYHNGYNITLVDSPGFNDTFRTETDVLQDIATWLKQSYENQRQRLSGIIYLHSIENVHMEGSALRNLRMFRELCGNDPLKNVILVTSFWSNVQRAVGGRREDELRTTPEFWGEMIRRGSRMERFTDRESALRIVDSLTMRTPVALSIQRELVEERKTLVETAAGQIVNEELARLEVKHRRELEELQREMRDALAAQDSALQQILREEQAKMDERLERINRQQAQLHADRRADRRRFECQLDLMSAHPDEIKGSSRSVAGKADPTDQEKKPNKLRKARPPTDEEPDVDWIVSIVRANESKISPEERTIVEMKIEEVKKQNPSKLNGKKIGQYLLGILRLALPLTSLILLGIPIHLPWDDSLGDKAQQGQNGEHHAGEGGAVTAA